MRAESWVSFCRGAAGNLLPSQQNQFRTEGRAHSVEQRVGAGFRAPALKDILPHHEHGSGREITHFAQALPRRIQIPSSEAESRRRGFENFGASRVQNPAADVLAGELVVREEFVRIVSQMVHDELWQLGERTIWKPFSEISQPMMCSVFG